MIPPSWRRRCAPCRARAVLRRSWCPDCSKACPTSRAWSRRGLNRSTKLPPSARFRLSPLRVAFVLKGYPRLSEAFIAQEIAALERRGLDILIVSLRRPTDNRLHPVHREIRAAVHYLPEYLYQAPLRVVRAWWSVRKLPTYKAARAQWLRDLARDRTPNRVRRFGQALVLAAELPRDIGRLHAHFLHTPASVARYAAILRGLAWSGSAHAKDIWTTPEWEKREKLAACDWLVTCTRANHAHLASLAPRGKVELVYHGIDLARFPAHRATRAPKDGGDARDPVTILSVARLVEKKGTDVLLAALARLPAALHWRFVHIGGRPPAPEKRPRALAHAGHRVQLASTFRTYDGDGDAARQRALRAQGEALAAQYAAEWRARAPSERPELWFTYHLYYKAPDYLGPA